MKGQDDTRNFVMGALQVRVNLLNTMQLAANLSDTIAREMCHRKSETFAKNYFTFDPS